ncbi:MAG: D-Ala-D-Ala carboxypeptidase family metallohydrolase [Ignavibacteriales bacterium]|nr:D-Ala-D-Ala carboxypeptidase family metallohydrolase [Ignavibacteriales bacterium]
MNALVKTKKDSSPDKSGFGMTNSHDIKLTNNFYLKEFVISQEAERHGYKNEPNEKQIENLRLLCVNVLQPLREIIDVPIFINSGFRSFDVNTAVGGKFNSQHLEGKAADFIIPSLKLVDVFNIVLQKLSFDQLIYEFGKWIHVSWNGESNRKDVMISRKVHGKTVYENVKSETLDVRSIL